MRVISGKFRGRKLVCPEGLDVRPTTDRVKENLFNLLQFRIQNSVVLDLFSGSGALGIEAISRGAKEVWFADQSVKSIAYLKENLRNAEFEGGILTADFRAALERLSGKKFDLIFLDPPYSKGLAEKAIEILVKNDMLSSGGVMVYEHLAAEPYAPISGIEIYDSRKYGQTELTLLRKA